MGEVYKWEVIGVGIIFIIGSLLHEAYDWSGQNLLIGFFAPVNESIWEHLKMGVTGPLIFAFVQYFFIFKQVNNFILAKTLSIIIIPVFIVVFHYGYKYFTGHHIVILDVFFFFVAIAIGQYVSYRLLTHIKHFPVLNILAAITLVFILSMFIYLTFYPLKLPIFQDGVTGEYGITK